MTTNPPRARDVLLALAGYAAVDVVIAMGGYPPLQRIVRRFPIRPCACDATVTLSSVRAALDRAAVWYPRARLCLARSAVATCLLRWHGLPSRMIVGARLMPFHAHAWVEVNGEVVNDSPRVQSTYKVLDRL
jgi:hypothetical protein